MGTVSVSQGSNTVTGIGTYFKTIGLVQVNSLITFDGGNKYYRIHEVIDDSNLKIKTLITEGPFEESSVSNSTYAIEKSFARQTNAGLAADFVNFQNELLRQKFEFFNWINTLAQRYQVNDINDSSKSILTPAGMDELLDDSNLKTTQFNTVRVDDNPIVLDDQVNSVQDITLVQDITRIEIKKREDNKSHRTTLVLRQGTGNNNVVWKGVSWPELQKPTLRKDVGFFDVIELIITKNGAIGIQQSTAQKHIASQWNRAGSWNG